MSVLTAAGVRASAWLAGVLPADETFDNPFDHTSPNISVFGVELTNRAYLILGGVWGAVVLALAFLLLIAIFKFGAAKKAQNNPDYLSDASSNLKLVGIALIMTVMVGPITAGLIGIFNS